MQVQTINDSFNHLGISSGIVGNVVNMAAEEDDFADFQSATAPSQNSGTGITFVFYSVNVINLNGQMLQQ